MTAIAVDQQRAEGCLGASEAPAALGLDRYRSPLDVWRSLRGDPPEDRRPPEVREMADWGNLLEPVIRGRYALAQGVDVYVPRESSVLDGWLRCTPDGIVTGPSAAPAVTERERVDGGLGHLQVKTCGLRSEWQWIRDGVVVVPERYEVQCRVELAVTGMPWCDVVCLIGGQRLVGPVRIVRDLAIEARILRDLRAFWDRAVAGEPPPPDATAAWLERASAQLGGDTVIAADADLEQLLRDWRTARNETRAHQQHADALRTSILLRLSAAGATRATSAIGTVSAYRTGARTDWRRYALALGGTEAGSAAHRAPPKTWALRAPNAWGGDDD